MIAFYPNGEKTPLNNYTDFHIVHKSDGNDEMFFSLATNDPQYPLLMEEMQIDAAGNSWLIKKIYDDDVSCSLNLDELKGTITKDYSSGSVTLANLLTAVLPSGWTHTGASQSSIRRTITLDFATPFDVLQRAMEVYDCSFVWNIPSKTVTVYIPSTMPVSGEYLTDELNLRKLSYQGDTSEFATRLYAYGKDGMTMEEAIVNGSRYGLTYVDNHDYSNKVIASYWTDERYTDPTSLYNDAVKKLAAVAKPIQSYECDAEDLAKESDEYSFLAFQIHRRITLIDRKRNLRVVHQVVEYDEYPEQPSRSKVTLSTVAPTVNSEINSRIADVEQNANNQALSEISRATALLTGAEGGYIVFHYDSDGKPYEMLIMNTDSEATATKVWRYNQNGWGFSANGVEGPYTLAATIDGAIIADFIKTGTLDCTDITVEHLTATDVDLDGIFTSEATDAASNVWKTEIKEGEMRVYCNNAHRFTIRHLTDTTSIMEFYHTNGVLSRYISSDGDDVIKNTNGDTVYRGYVDGSGVYQQVYYSGGIQRKWSDLFGTVYRDSNNVERLRINADGGIYAFDSNGNNAAALGGGGAHQLIVYDANGSEFSKFTGTTSILGGVPQVASRRVSKSLSSAGWYRAIVMNCGRTNPLHGELGELLRITVGREYGDTSGESHQIDFSNQWYEQNFANEVSNSKTQLIDKIRATYGDGVLNIDIHYTGTNTNTVSVTFSVEGATETTNQYYTAGSLQSVAAAPSGETVITTYSFSANGMITAYGDLSKTGENQYPTPSAVSVPDSTFTDIASVTLGAGTWLMATKIRFAKNGTGYRFQRLSTTAGSSGSNFSLIMNDSAPALADDYAYTQGVDLIVATTEKTYYLKAWQNSGGNLSCTGRIIPIRIC